MSVYKLSTLTHISQDLESETAADECLGVCSSKIFCLSTGSQIHVLNSTCSEHLAIINLDCLPEVMALNGDSTFLAVGDSFGTIHFIHVESGSIVLSHALMEDRTEKTKAFKSLRFSAEPGDGVEELFVVISTNTMFRFSNINFAQLEGALTRQDAAAAMEVKTAIEMERIDLNSTEPVAYEDVTEIIIPPRTQKQADVVISGKGTHCISKWKRQPNQPGTVATCPVDAVGRFGSDDNGAKKVHVTPDSRYMVVLDELTGLSLWDYKRLTLLRDYRSKNISDFVLLGSSKSSPIRIALTTEPQTKANGISVRTMQIVELPQFSTIFEVEVALHSVLINPIESSSGSENLMALVEICEDASKNRNWKVQSLSEVIPLTRFDEFLTAEQWEEAESFASKHELDVQIVRKSKVQSLSRRLENETEDLSKQCEIQAILDDLNVIADDLFVIDFCCKARLDTFDHTQRLLSYAVERLRNVSVKPEEKGGASVIETLHQSNKRLGTYKMLLETSNPPVYFNARDWQRFRTADLVTEMRELVAGRKINAAIIVWRRHCIDSNLISHIVDIVNEIPESEHPDNFTSWLKYEICPLVQKVEEKAKLMNWVETRARVVEHMHKNPYSALRVIQLFDPTTSSIDSVRFFPPTPSQYVQHASLLANSSQVNEQDFDAFNKSESNLRKQLEDLVYIWDHHDLKLSLAEYSQLSHSTLALDLLDRVAAPELLPDAVNNHFKAYVDKYGLSSDELLAEYCMEVIDGGATSSSGNFDAPWESRVLILLNCIQNAEMSVDVVLELMRRSPVPWSEAVEEAIQKILTQPNIRRYNEVSEQYRLMQLKKMLLKYGIQIFNISNLSLAQGLISHIVSQYDVLSAMQDALQVVNAYHHLRKHDAYVLRLQNLCSVGRTQEVRELLRWIWEEEVEDAINTSSPTQSVLVFGVGHELVAWLLSLMDEYNQGAAFDDEDLYLRIIDSAVATVEFLLEVSAAVPTHLLITVPSSEMLSNLKSLQLLHKEFGVTASLKSINGHSKKDLVFSLLAKHETMDDNISDEQSQTLHQRLREILHIDYVTFSAMLAENAVKIGNVRLATSLCMELYENSSGRDVAEIWVAMANSLTKYIQSNPGDVGGNSQSLTHARLTEKIQLLGQQAITQSHISLLSQCLDCFKYFEIQNKIFAQCEAGDYNSMISVSTEKVEAIGNTTGCAFVDTCLAGSSTSSSSSSMSNHLSSGNTSASGKGKGKVQNLLPIQSSPHTSYTDKFGLSVVKDSYYEHGLVLNTQDAMSLSSQFVLDSAHGITELHRPSVSSTISKSKAKMSDSAGDFIRSFRLIMEYLRKYQIFQTSIRVFHLSQELVMRRKLCLSDAGDLSDLIDTGVHHSLLETCVQKVLSSRFIDHPLAFAYIICLPLERAFSSFKTGLAMSGTDYNRLVKVASIGIASAIIWKQRSFLIDCKQISSNAKWWHQLKLLDIPFDDAQFRASKDYSYHRKLVPLLLARTSFDIMTGFEFAKAYNIEDDFVIIEFIKGIILTTSVDNYQNLIAGVIDDVVNKSKLLSMLFDQCLPKISPYDYERVRFILSQILNLEPDNTKAKKGVLVIDILANYTRANSPTIDELRQARKGVDSLDHIPTNDELDELIKKFPQSTRRLPFHALTGESYPVLKSELSEETLSRLIPLTLPLGLPADKFYVTVIDNMIKKMKQSPTNIQDKEPAMNAGKPKFADFKNLILKIRDGELAASSAKYIADQFPCGLDKIQALKTALQVAERWHTKLMATTKDDKSKALADRTEVAITRLKESLLQTETEHQLRSAGLMEFLDLISNPLELICQLYSNKGENIFLGKENIDLHSLAADVGKRHNIDVEKVRQYLLTTWLTKESNFNEEEGEPRLPSSRMQINGFCNSRAETSLQLSILYLLNSGSVEKNAALLLNFAYQQKTSQKVTTLTRIRALSVLFQLASRQIIDKIHNYNEVKSYLRMLLYLADFEELKISQTLKEFNGCQKDALAKSLWVKYCDEPKVIQLICNLCIDYKIYDNMLWENSLKRLMHFKTYRYLLAILEHVSSISELSQLSVLPKAWSNVIIECLKDTKMTKGATVEFYSSLLILLQKCPFILEIPSTQIYESLLGNLQANPDISQEARLSLLMKSLSVLPLEKEGSKVYVQTLLQDCSEEQISQLLITLHDKIDDPVSNPFESRRAVVQSVFEHINQAKLYHTVVETPYLPAFLETLIEVDRCDGVITEAIRNDLLDIAKDLVCAYFQRWPEKLEVELTEGDDLLKYYVRMNHLEESDTIIYDYVNKEMER